MDSNLRLWSDGSYFDYLNHSQSLPSHDLVCSLCPNYSLTWTDGCKWVGAGDRWQQTVIRVCPDRIRLGDVAATAGLVVTHDGVSGWARNLYLKSTHVEDLRSCSTNNFSVATNQSRLIQDIWRNREEWIPRLGSAFEKTSQTQAFSSSVSLNV